MWSGAIGPEPLDISIRTLPRTPTPAYSRYITGEKSISTVSD